MIQYQTVAKNSISSPAYSLAHSQEPKEMKWDSWGLVQQNIDLSKRQCCFFWNFIGSNMGQHEPELKPLLTTIDTNLHGTNLYRPVFTSLITNLYVDQAIKFGSDQIELIFW